MIQPDERRSRVREILDLALERPTMERNAFVAGACAGDTALRDEVISLLGALDQAGGLLEPPAGAAGAPSAPAVPLTGLRFGTYVVGDRIGAGGMGVVYSGTDSRLGRTVAIKALPPELGDDAHRRARFEHEARVVAALNHPNIAAIYGVEETPRGPVMVLEHVPGDTLAKLLSRGRLPVEEVVGIGRQIARALESAHAAGIVHRDLKPANIKVSPDGTVKVLDFGVAKVVGAEWALGGVQHTRAGDVIGTASYMSPEQARGRPVDCRTDLWALGCILYELLTGQQAFPGQTGSDAIAAVLRADPDWSLLPPKTPPSLRRLLRRCLERDADLRLRDAGDARLELDDAEAPAEGAPAPERRRASAALAAGLLLLGAAGGAGALLLLPRAPVGATARAPTRFVIETRDDAPLRVSQSGRSLALSPDGRQLAYGIRAADGTDRLLVQQFDRLEPIELVRTESLVSPCFSPDGRWIAYGEWPGSGALQRIRKVRTDGSDRRTITECSDIYQLTWSADDHLLFITTNGPGICSIPAGGGPMTTVVPPEGGAQQSVYIQAETTPDCQTVLFTCARLEGENYRTSVEAVRLATGLRRPLVQNATHPACFRNGILYYQDGAAWWAPWNPASLELTGAARRVLSPLAKGEMLPAPRYAVCEAGTLAYLPSLITYESTELAWFGRSGPPTTALRTRGLIESLRLSPDGSRVAVAAGWIAPDIWVHDLERGAATRLSTQGSRYYPVWTCDGKRVAFHTCLAIDWNRIDWQPADASAPAETLFEIPRPGTGYPNSFTPDGKDLIFTMRAGRGEREELYVLPLDGSRAARPLMNTPTKANRLGARLNPEGTLIAYTADQTGNYEIYVQPYPALDQLVGVSIGGGMRAAWSGDGKQLFFRWQDSLYEADIDAGPPLRASTPRLVRSALPEWRYDASPDGSRFIMGRTEGGSGQQTRINVVQNWDVELFGNHPSGPATP